MKFFGLILCLFFLTSCTQSTVQQNNKLASAIETVLEDNEEKAIDLTNFADFKWDKAYIFHPYTTQSIIDRQLNVDFKDPSNMSSRDDIYLLVFLQDEKVVQYAEISREHGELTMNSKDGITPSEPIIELKPSY
ncbi:hypothetical protein VBD025_14380 [Virgibacillus flavescens]|uniref:hypothetical protein n=1 Tax=Virgibacillus flavescens TaxID=1611422 RepID=UPI003D33F68A